MAKHEMQRAKEERRMVAMQQEFQGPIPPPQLLAQYESITPGLADRIVKMAEQESVHRREVEHKLVDVAVQDQKDSTSEVRLGQIFAFFIGIVTIVCGSYVVLAGFSVSGTVLGSSGVLGLVTAFIMGRNKKQPEGDEKE